MSGVRTFLASRHDVSESVSCIGMVDGLGVWHCDYPDNCLELAQADGERWAVSGVRPAAAEVMKRGRGRPRKHVDQAARQAAYRERKGVIQVNVELPPDVAEALDAFVARQVDGAGLGKSEVIVKLLRSQLLRKR